MNTSETQPLHRLRLDIRGIVQGVGFRPFVFNLAKNLALTGSVRNTASGAGIQIQGSPATIENFCRALETRPPAPARITAIERHEQPPVPDEPDFRILDSDPAGPAAAAVSPDMATCPACRAELLDPANRRHNHAFINCTACGPRFTVCERVPYDRPNTTMKHFPMCPACAAEYDNPADRRFHAQPVACPDCGPQLRFIGPDGTAAGRAALPRAAALLRAGAIVAVKGLGGFHLACDARNPAAVDELRARKFREDKPFAVMAASTDQARAFCTISADEQRFLEDQARPILLLEKRADPDPPLPAALAPLRATHGVMLPYTPLHHLLLREAGAPLVMTSGNRGDEPIAFRDDDAFQQLAGVASAFLTHDRAIHMRCDDSVARVWRGRLRLLRRARGFVPAPLPLPIPAAAPLLACGPDLKNTFTLARADQAIVSHHIGDLDNPEACASFEQAVIHYQDLFGITPRVIAYDMHPDYRSTAYALARARGLRAVAVQHHHAHIASCLADAGETGPCVGAALDGTGYGPDATAWGGEFLIADLHGFQRAAHLAPLPLPGADQAVRHPWRMAAACLYRALGPDFLQRRIAFNDHLILPQWDLLRQMLDSNLNCPPTSSMGRLFDAVSVLCRFREEIHYEGQAAVELEALCRDAAAAPCYDYTVVPQNPAPVYGAPQFSPIPARAGLLIDTAPIIRGVVLDLENGCEPAHVSARFHATVADMIARVCEYLCRVSGIPAVALSGGVFQNFTLLDLAARQLERRGLRVITHEHVPPGDGGLSLGQAAIAAAAGIG